MTLTIILENPEGRTVPFPPGRWFLKLQLMPPCVRLTYTSVHKSPSVPSSGTLSIYPSAAPQRGGAPASEFKPQPSQEQKPMPKSSPSGQATPLPRTRGTKQRRGNAKAEKLLAPVLPPPEAIDRRGIGAASPLPPPLRPPHHHHRLVRLPLPPPRPAPAAP